MGCKNHSEGVFLHVQSMTFSAGFIKRFMHGLERKPTFTYFFFPFFPSTLSWCPWVTLEEFLLMSCKSRLKVFSLGPSDKKFEASDQQFKTDICHRNFGLGKNCPLPITGKLIIIQQSIYLLFHSNCTSHMEKQIFKWKEKRLGCSKSTFSFFSYLVLNLSICVIINIYN